MQTVHADLRNLSDVVSKEIVKNTKFNTLRAEKHSIGKKTLVASTLIYDSGKPLKSVERKMKMLRIRYLTSVT